MSDGQPSETARLRYRFTLTELLVLLALLVVLGAILFPFLANAVNRAREHTCADNLRQVGVAVSLYEENQDSFYPLTYGQLSTSDGPVEGREASRQSMARLIELLGGRRELLYCPSFQHRSDSDRKGVVQSDYLPGGELLWGYNKFAGTLNLEPFGARNQFYTRYRDANAKPVDSGPSCSGYLSRMQADRAVRYYVVRGYCLFGKLQWQAARKPLAYRSPGAPTPIPLSQICLFADSNNVGIQVVSTAHALSDPQTVPPLITGVNELMADGHVGWYDIDLGALYYVDSREAGGAGVFVQDDR